MLSTNTEKYWHMRKLGLKEAGQEEMPSSSSSLTSSSFQQSNHGAHDYYHYHHMTPAYPSQLPTQAYINHNNRISFFEKVDRSIPGSHRNPSGQ